jgi:hypothetical protein
MKQYPRFKFYHKLEKDKEHTHAKITITYNLGGINYFDGNHERRGIYVIFSKVNKGPHSESFTPMASYNFKILARELNRFNKKKIEELTKKIGEKEDELFDLYLKGEKQKLLMMIKEAS